MNCVAVLAAIRSGGILIPPIPARPAWEGAFLTSVYIDPFIV